MADSLPDGTVTLVFSDVEGSTALLALLGEQYAQALAGQREVLRSAWAAHGGVEMGTEGDSFFVVFSTAPAAVAAVVQAQRGLVSTSWPQGARIAVRMGVHTGSPAVVDGGYVGMDVHRAARIAGAAHGGQIVVSEATAALAGAVLPGGVRLRDLGTHHLRDIAVREHLFQVTGEGLQDGFPPLRSLGTDVSLPRPGTELVGRDGELAELTALLGPGGARLVSLTGPGGSGKTRLAIGVAHQLVASFPDGVYFVPLASVTSAEVMWTSIAEVLNVPPEGRIPPGFFQHVAHRTALFVLDNLEQLPAADAVIAELLQEAPQAVVIATSRRPLHLQGENEHAVPPLDLPDVPAASTDSAAMSTAGGLAEAEAAGAVRLFVQQANMVKRSFRLTTDNYADVVSICRRLDGLPLAIELAAARIKLLSPRAVLTRLDQVLDLRAGGVDRPSRQQTLREAIGWSYRLLTPTQQAFFRRLGVFAGGADLDAVTAVTDDLVNGVDPLDLIGELVDASLVAVADAADGEPRIRLLETIRAYALDELAAAGELDHTRQTHTQHYLKLAEQLNPLTQGEQRGTVRVRYETEHNNFRQALDWTLQPQGNVASRERPTTAGLRLVIALQPFWDSSGYHAEASRWFELAIDRASGIASLELARCLERQSKIFYRTGRIDEAHRSALASVAMSRQLNDTPNLPFFLGNLAWLHVERGDLPAAREVFEEAIALDRDTVVTPRVLRQRSITLMDFAGVLDLQGEFDRSLEMCREAVAVAEKAEFPMAALIARENITGTLRRMGRPHEAEQQMRDIIPAVLALDETVQTVSLADDYIAILAELGDYHRAVLLLGAADATRERVALPRAPSQEADLAQPRAASRSALSAREWQNAYQTGRNTTVEQMLIETVTHYSKA